MPSKSNTLLNEKAISFCPRCQASYSRSQMSGDYVHNCNSPQAVLNQESILVIGNWNDYTGSDVNTQSNRTNFIAPNTLQGGIAGIEGARFSPVDVRGFPVNRYRIRQHLEYIDNKDLKINTETDQSDIEEHK